MPAKHAIPSPCICPLHLRPTPPTLIQKTLHVAFGKTESSGGIRSEACRKVARPGERLSQPAEDSLRTNGTTGPRGTWATQGCRTQVHAGGVARSCGLGPHEQERQQGRTCRGAWVGAGGGGARGGVVRGSIPGAKSSWGPRSEHPLRPQGLLRAPRQPQPVPLKINRHPTIHRGLFSPPTPDGLSGDGRGPWVRAVAVFDELCTYGYPNIWSGHVLLGAGQPWRANQEPRGARGCARPSQRALINYS